MNVSRRLVITAAVLLLVAATAYAYWRSQVRDGGDDYLTETLRRGSVASTVTASGTVNPVTTVQVGTYVSGPIKAIYADFNSRVAKGQLVAKIDPAPFQVKVRASEAAVANAKAKVLKDKADLAFKKLTLQRNQQLLRKNLIAQSDLDTARNDYDQATAQLALDEAGVQQAEADLEAARINLAYTDIQSPVDGVVVSRSVDVGQTVAASFQTPTLFLIAQDLTKMQVDANVSESDIGPIAVGQPVTFRVDAYPDRDFKGKVVQVRNAPINVQNVITYDVVAAVDNPRLELRPGMTATVTITTAESADALLLPVRALRFRPERREGAETAPPHPSRGADASSQGPRSPAVWTPLPDGSLKRVKVQTGVQNESYAELVGGDLLENDRVVVGYRRPEAAAGASAQRPPAFLGGGAHRIR
ncbi:MAG TPA: efflux RND transporter periplasmic adaptor subunit [Candidatus Binatia bacterium]|nr:efflux RND transporter periplasmic adaptor subunit [Candidatus Binatia bacterium]